MKKATALCLFTALVVLLQSCAIVRPGEAALKVRYGKVEPGILKPGKHARGLIGTRIVRFDTRTIEYSTKLNFHSQEGIEVTSDITMLYRVIPDSIRSIYRKFDHYYETAVIINNLITAVRQEGLNHQATALITERSDFEKAVKEKLGAVIGKYGFVVDLVMLKDVDLPPNVVATIQSKLNAEQLSKKTTIDLEIKRKELDYNLDKERREAELEITKQRLTLDFALEKQKKESERLVIESEGIKKSQDLLNSSITDKLIQFKALEITRDLVKSPNAKIIITDGKTPVIMNDKN